MGKNKKLKYRQVVTFENVTNLSELRPGNEVARQGRWAEETFGNTNPLVLELACGKGDYALGLARSHPGSNFIGMDIKGERLWMGAREALQTGVSNVHFIRGRVDHIEQIFDNQEISEIWITFPDPFLKFRRRTRRLTHPRFLDRYRNVLKAGGLINLKTDSPELYEFTLETIQEEGLQLCERIDDVYALKPIPEKLRIQTYYEKMHLEEGRTIRYVSFRL